MFAYIFLVLTAFIIVFQVALALGAPLGEYTLGGRYPGSLPNGLRIAALFQILILLIFASVVVARAGLGLAQYSGLASTGIWFIAAFFAFGTLLNLSSPSKKEKRVMGPANVIALVCTLALALGWGRVSENGICPLVL